MPIPSLTVPIERHPGRSRGIGVQSGRVGRVRSQSMYVATTESLKGRPAIFGSWPYSGS
jgi:hypothetical protein